MDYRATIPWHVLRKHLQDQQRRVDARLRNVSSDADFRMLQGRAQVLAELLNLPETLTVLEQKDESETEGQAKE